MEQTIKQAIETGAYYPPDACLSMALVSEADWEKRRPWERVNSIDELAWAWAPPRVLVAMIHDDHGCVYTYDAYPFDEAHRHDWEYDVRLAGKRYRWSF